MTDDAVTAAADRLEQAQLSGAPCAPVRDLIAVDDETSAYAVQAVLAQRRQGRGARVVGHKIGLTSPAVQRQLGVDRPDFGTLFDDMARVGTHVSAGADAGAGDATGDAGTTTGLSMEGLLQPRIEAEVAFVLGQDLADGHLDVVRVRSAVTHAVAAFEIVDSRIADWDITFADTVADNGSSGLFVLGDDPVLLTDVEPREVEMIMTADGETVSQGNGAACLGDPLAALAWLATTLRAVGQPLRAGEVVLSGALGPMVPLRPDVVYEARISGLGTVRTRFHAAKEQA